MIAIPGDWERELSDRAFVTVLSEEQALEEQWEVLRNIMSNDPRTLGELEAATGRTWVVTRRTDPISFYVDKKWSQLRAIRGMGLKKIRTLIEILSLAKRN
ncbi:hypothetical protein SDC9_181383 [bioreactor metagenome]|uniref:Uncharacterized protein n=1 Tax=bioreactor metagenome TaxID=1076179 RepID=A0A645H4F0_9ZZZZ